MANMMEVVLAKEVTVKVRHYLTKRVPFLLWIMIAIPLTMISMLFAADDPPLVRKFLETGELARGEQALERELEVAPGDDQLRFSLGLLQIVRGVERLGQTLHEYGAKSSDQLFLRLPVPENKDPVPINAFRFRRFLDDFRRDLLVAEATLSKVTVDDVHLRLNLADIQLDLDADGRPTDKFGDILRKLFRGRRLGVLDDDPHFQVNFDRGDVAWLRAYCHLLVAMIDGTLSSVDDPQFEVWADQYFARPMRTYQGPEERWLKSQKLAQESALKEPKRLHRVRLHLIRVTELNKETWEFIRKETDDDQEWLPNSKQTGVLKMPVRDEMIDNWLKMMAELKLMLEGERLFPDFWDNKHKGKGLNVKLLLEEPPESPLGDEGLPEKYFTEGKFVDIGVFGILFQMFTDPALVGYPIWFN